jgi:hypothetical protein
VSTEWPQYVSHRVVRATPIVRIEKKDDGSLPLLFVDPSMGRDPQIPFFPTEPQMAHRCQVLDMAMEYEDNYRSLIPRRAFDLYYSPHKAEG